MDTISHLIEIYRSIRKPVIIADGDGICVWTNDRELSMIAIDQHLSDVFGVKILEEGVYTIPGLMYSMVVRQLNNAYLAEKVTESDFLEMIKCVDASDYLTSMIEREKVSLLTVTQLSRRLSAVLENEELYDEVDSCAVQTSGCLRGLKAILEIEDLIEFGRPSKMKVVNLSNEMNFICEEVRRQLHVSDETVFFTGPMNVYVRADRDKLNSAIIAMMLIAYEEPTLEKDIKFALKDTGGQAVVTITVYDHGNVRINNRNLILTPESEGVRNARICIVKSFCREVNAKFKQDRAEATVTMRIPTCDPPLAMDRPRYEGGAFSRAGIAVCDMSSRMYRGI